MKRFLALLVLIAASAVVVQAAAADTRGNQLLASGTVTESLGGPAVNWTILFSIHARGNGLSTVVSITQGLGGPTSTFDGSACSGSYTDPVLGGTDVYAVGRVVSGNQIYGTPYEAFIVHEGGPLGADRSWSVPVSLPDLASAQAFCDNQVTGITPAFALVSASDLVFKV